VFKADVLRHCGELGAIPRGMLLMFLAIWTASCIDDELRVAGPELKEMLLELVVPEKRRFD